MIMPQMGGAETYRKLKAINPRVKVLVSSGYSLDSRETEALIRESNGFIQKPFKLEELSEKLTEILSNGEALQDPS